MFNYRQLLRLGEKKCLKWTTLSYPYMSSGLIILMKVHDQLYFITLFIYLLTRICFTKILLPGFSNRRKKINAQKSIYCMNKLMCMAHMVHCMNPKTVYYEPLAKLSKLYMALT